MLAHIIRPFIIGGAILVGVMAVITIATLIISGGILVPKNKKVLSVLQENYEAASWMENFFADTYYSRLTVNATFTSEIKTQLHDNLAKLEILQKTIADIKPSALKTTAQQNFATLQTQLNERVPAYHESVTLYNSLYEAYITNTPGSLTDLAASENYYTSITAERFSNFLTKKDRLWADIRKDNCDSNSAAEICPQMKEEYFNFIAELSSSTFVVSAIFSAYYDGSYAEDNRFMPHINALLEELK